MYTQAASLTHHWHTSEPECAPYSPQQLPQIQCKGPGRSRSEHGATAVPYGSAMYVQCRINLANTFCTCIVAASCSFKKPHPNILLLHILGLIF
ncbi:hypothetical protein COCC4DRAFT_29351 [Bipolaris maydis ATCC 48331]|uniref:Uncharacterized protein n=2 Tax=Cochliobolus heterostrophus TaxID=5016 RepID=M2UAY2_COCH5|nr:uncharacterized protein COCC4DRAFT_29351 [Bipolaris maydis ATCC 48331]EMD95734.1 hypothetical protein COCHEDRAFT_1019362 [Bipolaris maydis C5]ENI10594.1 hypothetical protein COCC4DRAFT_29351 [Bipolaris maydis ATCC 48331]